jgi:hypothetical protein
MMSKRMKSILAFFWKRLTLPDFRVHSSMLLSFPPRLLDANARDEAAFQTPLHYAVAAEQADVCRL